MEPVYKTAARRGLGRLSIPTGEPCAFFQPEITTLTVSVIWARASAACQPSAEAGAGPVAERARADEFDAVGGPCGEASEVAIAVLHVSSSDRLTSQRSILWTTHRMPRMPEGEGGEARGRLSCSRVIPLWRLKDPMVLSHSRSESWG